MSDGASIVQPGDVIAEKYRVERVIGRGGMGLVVAAEHIQLGQRVAIKLLLPEALGNNQAEAIVRFQREGRAVVKLHSDHIARVFDVGTLPTGAPYMVIELLEGSDLADEITKRGALPIREAIAWILQACDAIHDAHGAGIVHRDIKPANIFLHRRPNRPPTVKVLDFGISKSSAIVQATSALTQGSAMMGSPLYMPPEQLRSTRDVDLRADIWSLGVTLYELVVGVPPFGGETAPALFANILTAPAPVPSRARPEIPAALDAIILRCLEKDPGVRFQTVADFVAALSAFEADLGNRGSTPSSLMASGVPASQTLAMSPSPSVGARSTGPVSDSMGHSQNVGGLANSLRFSGISTQSRGGHRAIIAIVATVAVGIVGVAGTFALRYRSPKHAPLLSATASTPARHDKDEFSGAAASASTASVAPSASATSEPIVATSATPTAASAAATVPVVNKGRLAAPPAHPQSPSVPSSATVPRPSETPMSASTSSAPPVKPPPSPKKNPLDINIQ